MSRSDYSTKVTSIRREVLQENARKYGWCSCDNPTRLMDASTFCNRCDRVIPEEKLPRAFEERPPPAVGKNPSPADEYTLKLELLLTDLLSVLRAFTCKHCSGAACDRCEQSGLHPFARRAVKRIQETLRKEWTETEET